MINDQSLARRVPEGDRVTCSREHPNPRVASARQQLCRSLRGFFVDVSPTRIDQLRQDVGGDYLRCA